jgi:hypothetical protein
LVDVIDTRAISDRLMFAGKLAGEHDGISRSGPQGHCLYEARRSRWPGPVGGFGWKRPWGLRIENSLRKVLTPDTARGEASTRQIAAWVKERV